MATPNVTGLSNTEEKEKRNQIRVSERVLVLGCFSKVFQKDEENGY